MDSVDGGEQSHSLAPGRGDEFMDISPLPPLPTVDYAPPVPPLPPLPAPAYPVVGHTESTACAVEEVVVEEALALVEEASSEEASSESQQEKTSPKYVDEGESKARKASGVFSERIAELCAYKEKHGHLRIDVKEGPRLKSLAAFCSKVRYTRNHPGKGSIKLTEKRIASLDALGFSWGTMPRGGSREETFSDRLEQLSAHRDKYGNVDVRKKENTKLAAFCSTVRYSRINPSKGTIKLTAERVAALDALGFRWELMRGARGNASFSTRLEELRSYKEEHGHLRVRVKEMASLAKFCGNVRYARNNPGKGGIKLSEDRIASLDALGFIWETKARKKGSKRRSVDDPIETVPGDKAETTKAILKRMACGDCAGCRRKACNQCDACTGSPKKRCIQRLCSQKVWVNGAEYAAWKASGKTTPKPPAVEVNKAKRNVAKTFQERLEELRAYKEEHGHPNVLKGEDPSLGQFCYSMRYARANPESSATKLTAERIAALDELGFRWENQSGKRKISGKSFADHLVDLQAYHRANGHVNVKASENANLVAFCCRVRKARKCPDKATIKLSEEGIRALYALGFDWTKTTKSFSDRVEELRAYRAEHGHMNVTTASSRKGLMVFCQKVRHARRFPEKGLIKLNQERIAALDELRFDWNASNISGNQARKSFAERVEELKAYKEKLGHLNVSKEEDSSLFHFTNNVRYGRSNPGKGMAITEDRVATLDAIGFPWKGSNGGVEGRKNDQSFSQRIEDLKAYKSEHGHLDVMQKENASLHNFCYNMRYARANPGKGMTITEDRVAALDAIGFPWSGGSGGRRVRKSFSERVEELAAYKEKHGHLKVSKEEDSGLFYFIRNAQTARRNPGKRELSMTDDRIAALDAIGFPWKRSKPTTRRWGGPQKQFDGRVNELKAYKSKHGHLNVGKKDDLSLHRFCRMARYARANPGKGGLAMAEGRIAALDAIGFPWKSATRKGSESATKPDTANLKRIACSDCEGCKMKACRECDACTGSPKKRCVHRLCTNQLWVDKAEYAAWKASGKSGRRPSPKEREGSGQSNENVDATAERKAEAAPSSEDYEVSFGKSGGQIEVRCNEMFSPLKRRKEVSNGTVSVARREDIMQLSEDSAEPREAPGQEMDIDFTEDHDEDSTEVPAFLMGGHETMSFSV